MSNWPTTCSEKIGAIEKPTSIIPTLIRSNSRRSHSKQMGSRASYERFPQPAGSLHIPVWRQNGFLSGASGVGNNRECKTCRRRIDRSPLNNTPI